MIVIAGLALTGTTSGCADRAPAVSSARVTSDPAVPTGTWRGTVGGRATTDAQYEEYGAATLTVAPDGTFTLEQTFGPMQGVATMRATGTARMTGGRIVLDGQVVTPASSRGDSFTATLWARGDALYGTTDVLYRGVKTGSQIALGRVP
jgi:hypothetical protein